EFGPGRALAHMAAPLFPGGAARALEEFRSLAGITGWLAG
ncbi:malonyl CoA-acyl carrier protein transacylase, partial [Acidocella sp. MX-AZ02]